MRRTEFFNIEPVDPGCEEAVALLDRLSQTLSSITGSSGRASFDTEVMKEKGTLFVLVRDADGCAVGCGAYRPLQVGVAELKRMFASAGTRGVGSALLTYLEDRARSDGYEAIWLETRRVNERAVRFYEKHGYRPIPSFGQYVGRAEAVCLGKTIALR
ncbi:GNAT family N-acetyltransferase [Consotaella salsifontis]|uniref:Acetyltransferase (GNAT) family protein n=1 Tax=Consotaella salsifontis TaxID=1365950 RepID=A0A1T4QKS3_9HYPH|nr:GNAT family N-acetyltransferase [Consotaella salsifontis]SKA04304.1 Acetyltransferase (GNAT) family protein [Consotaella salsifontis]